MSTLFWLTEAQLELMKPHFPPSHGIPRVDDRHVLSGIIHVIRNGLRRCDAPVDYGPHKTLYNRFVRWSELGVFDRIFSSLVAEEGPPDTLIIDATHLKAHRTAASLQKRGSSPSYRTHQRRVELQTSRHHRWQGAAHHDGLERRANVGSSGCQAAVPSHAKRPNADRR